MGSSASKWFAIRCDKRRQESSRQSMNRHTANNLISGFGPAPRVVAVIQARMGSTRLPGKVLHQIGERSMLGQIVNRVRQAHCIDEVVIATTTNAADEAVVTEAHSLRVPVYRGNEEDVLERFVQAAREMLAHTIVRITADCPLIDPAVVDLAIATFRAVYPTADYVSNTLQRTYPRGLDVEVFTKDGLEQAAKEANTPHQREHVTPFFYENPHRFRLQPITNDLDCSAYRWTVDTREDLDFVREIYRRLETGECGWRNVLSILEKEPALCDINRHVPQHPLIEH